MAKIYSPPEGFDPPQWDPKLSHKENDKAEDEYMEKLKAWAKKHGKGKTAGEMIYFPVADGKAVYMVFSLKPVTLIHVPVGDAWHFQYAHRLTASDVRKEIEGAKTLRGIFATAKKGA